MTNRHWQIHTTLPSLIALMELIFICVPLITWKLHTFYAWHILHSFSERLWWERGGKRIYQVFFSPFQGSNWSSSWQSILLYGPTFLHYCCNQVAAERRCTQKNMVEIFRFFFFSPLNRWDLGCPCFPTMALRCFLSPHSRCCLNMKLFTVARGITLLSVLTNLFLMETALHLERIFNILEHFLIFFFFFILASSLNVISLQRIVLIRILKMRKLNDYMTCDLLKWMWFTYFESWSQLRSPVFWSQLFPEGLTSLYRRPGKIIFLLIIPKMHTKNASITNTRANFRRSIGCFFPHPFFPFFLRKEALAFTGSSASLYLTRKGLWKAHLIPWK